MSKKNKLTRLINRRDSTQRAVNELNDTICSLKNNIAKSEQEAMLGRYFVYTTTISETEYWETYYRVERIGDYQTFWCLGFDQTPEGITTIIPNCRIPWSMLKKEISKATFNKILKELVQKEW